MLKVRCALVGMPAGFGGNRHDNNEGVDGFLKTGGSGCKVQGLRSRQRGEGCIGFKVWGTPRV